MIVTAVVQQHADDAAMLAASRMDLVEGPYATLGRLVEFDRRVIAHLDGLRLSGESGRAMAESALETPSRGAVFPLAVSALQDRDEPRLARLVAFVQAVPDTTPGLLLAFGWADRHQLHGTIARLLRDPDGFKRMLGVAVCAMHGVDPRLGSGRLLRDPDPAVRARAFRAVGELGIASLLRSCTEAIEDDDQECGFWSAWSAVLLGDHGAPLDLLARHAFTPAAAAHRVRAFRLALQALAVKTAHGALQRLAADRTTARWIVEGSGIVGDPAYVPWLIKQMDDLAMARLAAESFTSIAGVDLAAAALDRPAPQDFDAGPNDDPDDPDVTVDPDDGLPWPDTAKVQQWWKENGARFQPGIRHFMGAPVTPAHCVDVLKNGYQRQRILAAHYLCLLDPGRPLFNTSAPAWRQQQLLAQMA